MYSQSSNGIDCSSASTDAVPRISESGAAGSIFRYSSDSIITFFAIIYPLTWTLFPVSFTVPFGAYIRPTWFYICQCSMSEKIISFSLFSCYNTNRNTFQKITDIFHSL